MEGIIHSFESMAALDGVGVRYCVFLAGCPFRCCYCHNPDTWAMVGQKYDAETLAKKIYRYKPYFKNGGGVTFSGGEPLLQANFINEISPLLKKEGIGYFLDTSGGVELTNEVKRAIDNADGVILDLKFPNKEEYKKYIHGDMDKVLKVGDYINGQNKIFWVRTVIVPGINDSEDKMDEYLSVLNRFTNVDKYELLAFHTMGFFKYEKLGIENPLINVSDLKKEVLMRLQDYVDKVRNGK